MLDLVQNLGERFSRDAAHISKPIIRIFSVFRQGDIGTNWYTVLSGSLEVQVSESGHINVSHSSHDEHTIFS